MAGENTREQPVFLGVAVNGLQLGDVSIDTAGRQRLVCGGRLAVAGGFELAALGQADQGGVDVVTGDVGQLLVVEDLGPEGEARDSGAVIFTRRQKGVDDAVESGHFGLLSTG